MSKRDELVALAESCVQQHAHFNYLEVRPMHLRNEWPWIGDCSEFVTWLFWKLQLPDPNNNGYNGWGNTTTLYAHGVKISLAEVQPGDIALYSMDRPLVEQHTAVVVRGGADPLTVSMGQQGDPSYVHVSQDGRKAFYVRCLPKATTPPQPAPQPKPTPVPTTPVALPDVAAGSTNVALVKTAQSVLKDKFAADLGPAGVDGVYGPSTVKAVQSFQAAHGLATSGIVNGSTWTVLLKG